MGRTTLDEFRDDVAGATGASDLSAATLTRFVNYAYQEIIAAVDFHELVEEDTLTFAAETRDAEIDSDSSIIDAVLVEPYKRLEWRDIQDLNSRDPLVEDDPQFFSRIGNSLRVWPTPAEELSVRVTQRKVPANLSANADVTALPATWDLGLYYLAVSHTYFRIGNENQGAVWYNRAISYLSSVVTDEDRGVRKNTAFGAALAAAGGQ